ncbi:hypothetical protein J3Q64DRAFT_1762174 [Phycomyces blakesleeanus]|uniref:Uncharacterized protein n=2 Tax=Phycomyces blakesleeanus TaxID=4837 RepID=A0A163ESR7_PHYB8|nr:hypothetical protein PHYBLDRAFT_79632 [Phycomyces blakesleeanus NRRL 1555(-)]OAD81340.1 hypothetical protein PHYBLDRAFT_79632 [Phycomyces blakesleeanus NRRL 1555(-)]|eukprot:XP_018299380.1 hypothetical protein PHYBLDRAFT_79632 [Phycomyces blakesleeanus NRRL 1555(-)]
MRFSILAIFCFFIATAMAATVHSSSSPSQVDILSLDLSSTLNSAPAEYSPSEIAGSNDLEKRRQPTNFVDVPIWINGTLFYIALSVSTLLWCTGKGIDMMLERQERLAEAAAY